jgi:hypothetical protein
VDTASFSSPRDISSGTNLLPVNGFIHAGTAVRKTSLEAWLPMPGLSLTWTKIVGAFQKNEFVKTFMVQSVLEKDAQQQQHISTPNIRVDHIGDSASEPNRGGAGQHKRRSASADAVAAPPAQAARSEDGPCGRGGRAEADGEVPGGAAAGAAPTGSVSADGASPGGSGGRGGGAGGAERATGDGGTAADGAPRSPPGRGLPTRPPGGACQPETPSSSPGGGRGGGLPTRPPGGGRGRGLPTLPPGGACQPETPSSSPGGGRGGGRGGRGRGGAGGNGHGGSRAGAFNSSICHNIMTNARIEI